MDRKVSALGKMLAQESDAVPSLLDSKVYAFSTSSESRHSSSEPNSVSFDLLPVPEYRLIRVTQTPSHLIKEYRSQALSFIPAGILIT